MAMSMGGRGRGGKGRYRPLAEINVTPMVDVMLVLLIIFMVTAPLLTAGVPVELPDSKAKPLDQDQQPVEIAMDREGHIYVDKLAVTDAVLPDSLAQIASKQQNGKPPQIFLRADRHLDYGKVMRVMGELNRAGLNRVSLVTIGGDGKTKSDGN